MKQILTILTYLFAGILYGQITTKEKPYGLRTGIELDGLDYIFLDSLDKASLFAEDSINDQQPCPSHFSYPVWVNYTLENSGVWQLLDDGSRIRN